MNEDKRYRVTFQKESGGYDDRFGDTIASLKQELKDRGDCKNCALYNTPTNVYEADGKKLVMHGLDDIEKEYATVNDFLNDTDLDT